MNMNQLLHITEATKQYNTTVASLLRMDTEGLVRVIKYEGDYFIVAADLRRVAELAKDDPRLMSCPCVGGPCECVAAS
jgi:hypothetical protein